MNNDEKLKVEDVDIEDFRKSLNPPSGIPSAYLSWKKEQEEQKTES